MTTLAAYLLGWSPLILWACLAFFLMRRHP